jgi:hypothetical protein
MERHLHGRRCRKSRGAVEKDMKIYLLVTLIGMILMAVHFTSVPEQRSKTRPQ